MSAEAITCPTCHHSSNAYPCRLSAGLVGTLIKFRGAIGLKHQNSIHLVKDMTGRYELSKTEYNNAQKLRFHGLIAHDREAGVGYWLLTSRGRKFLDGELSVPQSVKTLNNHVIDHDPVHVTVTDVMGTRPVFDDYAYWHSSKEAQPFELAQLGLAL